MRIADTTTRLAAALLATAAALFTTTSTAPVKAQEPAKEEKKPAKPADWPDVDDADERRIKSLIRKLVHDDEDKRADAKAALEKIGADAGKTLVRAITPRKPELHEPVFAILDAVTTSEHSLIVAEEITHKHLAMRRWATRRLARMHAKDAAKALTAAMKDEDEQVRFHAALGLCGLGDWSEFDLVFERCSEDFQDLAPLISEVLAPQRNMDAASEVMKRVDSKKEGTVITALRIMRTVGPKEYGRLIAMYLDNNAHAIKKAAINALRVMIDGDEPIENLSVFQVIGTAKKWKERVK